MSAPETPQVFGGEAGVEPVILLDKNHYFTSEKVGGFRAHSEDDVTHLVPLDLVDRSTHVVIDPEDSSATNGLVVAAHGHYLTEQLRSLLVPPPKPPVEEPGVGGRVEASTSITAARRNWTRYTESHRVSSHWISENGLLRRWSDLVDPEVIERVIDGGYVRTTTYPGSLS